MTTPTGDDDDHNDDDDGDDENRKHTESLINERVAIMKQSSSIEEAEKRIGMGQIEEVIIQAENELMLARKNAICCQVLFCSTA